VGKGNHSAGHVQKIKPRVEQVCQQMGLDYATEANEGRMYIDLTGGKVNSPPPLPQQPSGYQGGYSSGGGYPGHGGGYQQGYQQQQQHGQQHYSQQQHHGYQQQQQHHQQHQPEDEIEKLARKFLPRIIRELKACCVVM
jgi:hypothetical protein